MADSALMDTRLPKWIRFASRTLREFFHKNHGLLLSGAVAFNMTLSLIPLSAVLMVVTSHFFDEKLLMESLSAEVTLIAPGFANTVTETVDSFLRNRQFVGWIGLLGLLFFSSMAFRVLENAIAIVFHRPLPALKRSFWVSAIMPYFFIIIISAGLILITFANAIIDAQPGFGGPFASLNALIRANTGRIIYLIGLCGLILLFSLFYKIMPVAKVSFRRALAGGLTAAILWEITRHLLVAYYTRISIVNVLYGSMATIIVVLLTMEAVAVILLLGAQVIAELQRNANAGIPWHEDPEPSRETHFP